MFLPEGFYSDGYHLIDRCNKMIECNLKDDGTIVDTKFAYDITSRKIIMHVGDDNVVTLSSDLASIMGFSPRKMTFSEERKYKGKVAMDPNRGFNSLYVYCDAAEAISVDDIKAPFYAWSMLLEISETQFTDRIRRLSTFQSERKGLTPWKLRYKGRHWSSGALSFR